MRHIRAFAVFVLLVGLGQAKDRWVLVPCPLARLVVVDWGKCRQKLDGSWDCPNAHMEFRTDCLARKNSQVTSTTLKVDRPTALITDDPGVFIPMKEQK